MDSGFRFSAFDFRSARVLFRASPPLLLPFPPVPPVLRFPSYVLSLLLLLPACAVPQPPTGGPVDQTPPAVVSSEPASEAVNVDTRTVRIVFSEYIDQSSFAQALSVTPAVEGRLDIDWSRRTVDITFPEPLRENTTYLLTLDKTLRDIHNVALRQPITLAFSTGPMINRGQLAGQVVDEHTGTGVADLDVYAYAYGGTAPPDPLPRTPDYRTQTDNEGRFRFDYLREQPYYVIALEDRNRNRQPDATEPFAVPPLAALRVDSAQATEQRPWVVARLDTVPPVAQRVRTFSSRRFAVRFSESVQLTDPAPSAWILIDSTSRAPVAVEQVYQRFDDPRQIFAVTDSLRPGRHRLVPPAVTDSSGNALQPDTLAFTPSTEADTLQLRFRAWLPAGLPLASNRVTLPPGAMPGLRFNTAIDTALLHAALTVADTAGMRLDFDTDTHNGTDYRVQIPALAAAGTRARLSLDNTRLGGPDTVYTRTYERVADRQLGAYSGVVAVTDTSVLASQAVAELYRTGDAPPGPFSTTPVDATGTFTFPRLPEGTYRLRVFLDRNGNGRWDGGQILPYQPAEPIRWRNTLPDWRARWDTVLEDTLRF